MVQGKKTNTLAVELLAREHKFLSGLLPANGGADEGPNPHELLEAALTACTILTAQLYANRRGMKLESTDVTVKVLSEGAESKISREVSFRGDLTAEEKAKLAEIVGKCPIHKLLESKITVETTTIE